MRSSATAAILRPLRIAVAPLRTSAAERGYPPKSVKLRRTTGAITLPNSGDPMNDSMIEAPDRPDRSKPAQYAAPRASSLRPRKSWYC